MIRRFTGKMEGWNVSLDGFNFLRGWGCGAERLRVVALPCLRCFPCLEFPDSWSGRSVSEHIERGPDR